MREILLEPEKLEDKAFELIRSAIGKGIHDVAACLCAANCCHGGTTLRRQIPTIKAQEIQIRSDEVVWVCAPARLDFAGGWSDTPPYCLEHGGSVLNAAVKLNLWVGGSFYLASEAKRKSGFFELAKKRATFEILTLLVRILLK